MNDTAACAQLGGGSGEGYITHRSIGVGTYRRPPVLSRLASTFGSFPLAQPSKSTVDMVELFVPVVQKRIIFFC